MKAAHWSHKTRLRAVMAPSGVQFAQVGRSVLKLCQNQNNGFTSAALHMEHHWHSDFIWWGNRIVYQIMKSSKREIKIRQEESNLCLKSLMILSEWCSQDCWRFSAIISIQFPQAGARERSLSEEITFHMAIKNTELFPHQLWAW